MAIVQNPNIGRTKQKLGNTVFSKQFGKNTLRTKPIEVKNPKTPRQVAQRTIFTTIVKILRPLVKVINVAFFKTGEVTGMSPYNKMLSYNLNNATNGTEVDWTKFKLCTILGNSFITDFVITAAVGHTIHCAWVKNSTLQQELASPVDAFLINKVTNEVLVLKAVAQRSDEQVVLTAPAPWVGDAVAVFLQCLDYQDNGSNLDPLHIIANATANLADVTIIA